MTKNSFAHHFNPMCILTTIFNTLYVSINITIVNFVLWNHDYAYGHISSVEKDGEHRSWVKIVSKNTIPYDYISVLFYNLYL